jgi:predicted aspartyl protease
MKWTFLLWLAGAIQAFAQTVEFKLHDGYLIVAKCSIGGLRDVIAVVDTGVTETAIDIRLAKRLDLSSTSDRATVGVHDLQVHAVRIPQIVFGPLRSESLAGIAIDLTSLNHQFGVRADVLIGMDLLRQQSFLIDYKARQIKFGPVPHLSHSAPLISTNRLLLVEALIGQKILRLQVDSGFNAILIYGGRVQSFNDRQMNSHSESFGLPSYAQPTSLPRLQIGNWKGTQIAAAVTDDEPGGDVGFEGLLGPTAIGARKFAIDFDQRVITWE